MENVFADYIWKEGIPYGIGERGASSGFKIVMDPYRKRISIEEYQEGRFVRLIYDSHLLDFRHLKSMDQTAWNVEKMSETESHVRDQNDRFLFIEKYTFHKDFCKECQIFTPYHFLLSTHVMHYKDLGDSFNGVILYDARNKPVMRKVYEIDDNVYTNLLEEQWDLCRN